MMFKSSWNKAFSFSPLLVALLLVPPPDGISIIDAFTATNSIPGVIPNAGSLLFRNNPHSSINSNKAVATITQTKKSIHICQATASSISADSEEGKNSVVSILPCGDELDKKLLKIAIPMICVFLITPLMGAIDLFFVNRMNNPLAVAGQAASNQIYNTAFWLASFLPSITATLVAKENAKNNTLGVQDSVNQALLVGIVISLLATPFMFYRPEASLMSVLKSSSLPAMQYAKPYLMIRSFAFLPGIISLIGFSACRGTFDMTTPIKITVLTTVINAILDPILIFTMKMGVSGAALATLIAELIGAGTYISLLVKRNFMNVKGLFSKLPKWETLKPLITGGLAMQIRILAMNITFLAVARVTQSLDSTGVTAAAHALALQTFQLGGVILFALSTVAQSVIPSDMVEKKTEVKEDGGEEEEETKPIKSTSSLGGLQTARNTSNRLMSWGFLSGISLGALQILALPWIFKATPMHDVRAAAKTPAIVASILQIINGLVFIGEGIMVGTQDFIQLAISTSVATLGCLWALKIFPNNFGLTGVWMGFGVFNLLRLIGVFIHQFHTSPISSKAIHRDSNK